MSWKEAQNKLAEVEKIARRLRARPAMPDLTEVLTRITDIMELISDVLGIATDETTKDHKIDVDKGEA